MKKIIYLTFGMMVLNTAEMYGMNDFNNDSRAIPVPEVIPATINPFEGVEMAPTPELPTDEEIYNPISLAQINPLTNGVSSADAEYSRAMTFVTFLEDQGYILHEQAEEFRDTLKGQRYGSIMSLSDFRQSCEQLDNLFKSKTYQQAFAEYMQRDL